MAEVWQGVAFCGDGPAGWGAGTQMVGGQDGVELGKNGIYWILGILNPCMIPCMYIIIYGNTIPYILIKLLGYTGGIWEIITNVWDLILWT